VIDRQLEADAALGGFRHHAARRVELVVFDQGLADRQAIRLEERVSHRAADEQRVDAPRKFSMTSILSETFAPPSTATNGRSGEASAMPRYLISSSIRKPAAAFGSSFAMPSVDACARWLEPKASFT